jgi:UPF0755 protein
MGEKSRSAMHEIGVVIQLLLNVLFYVALLMAVVSLSTKSYTFAYQVFGNVTVSGEPGDLATIEVTEGEGTKAIAKDLETKGLVVDKDTFYVRAKLTTGEKKPILPGTYTLSSAMTYDEILSVLTAGATGEEN